MIDGLLTTAEVSRLTGCSLRQLQHWDETGVLKARKVCGHGGGGWCRVYSESQVKKAQKLRLVAKSGRYLTSQVMKRVTAMEFDKVHVLTRPVVIDKVLLLPPGAFSRKGSA